MVALGDEIEEGAEIASVSTDKVDFELPSPCAGTIVELLWTPGDTVPVGEVLIRIEQSATPEAGSAPSPDPVPVPAAAPANARARTDGGAQASVRALGKPALMAPIVAAPALRRLAHERGVELGTLLGSGPEGRILMRDLEAAGERPAAEAAEARPASAAPRREPLSRARAVAAERLAQSVHTLAHSTISFEVTADALEALLEKLATEAERRRVKLTPVALIAKCLAAALRDHPRLNATIDEAANELLLHAAIDLGLAVATPGGLTVPVVRGVDRLSLFELAAAVADLAERAREGRLEVSEVRGGTFTLSSTASLERATLTSARPIVNPPQTAVLWVSRIVERPRVIDGELSAGPMMAASLSFDHRYIDGADATYFINDLAALFECPERALA